MPKRAREDAVVSSVVKKVTAAVVPKAAAAGQQFWLMKSEPDVFSLADLKKKGVEHWDGVRNYQARNNMRLMKKGDRVLFYHSNAKPSGIVGTATVATEAYPDHTAWLKGGKYFDAKSTAESPVWDMVDVKYESTFKAIQSLEECKADAKLKDMVLIKSGRLSVQSVKKAEFDYILAKAGAK